MRILRPHRAPAAVMAVVGCAAVVGVAAAQPVPSVPGARTERFRLVVEGATQATRDLDIGGSNPLCTAQVNLHLTEATTWRRGRGVVVRFTQLGRGPNAPVLMTRVGSARPTFTVAVTTIRTSSGAESRTPSGPPEACPPVSGDLSKGPDCGKPDVSRAVIGALYAGGLLRIVHVGLGAIPEIDCPVSEVLLDTPDPQFGWPTPPPVRPASVPRGLIFGARRAFVIHTDSPRTRTSEAFSAGSLSGRVTDFGHNRVTIRFIRLT